MKTRMRVKNPFVLVMSLFVACMIFLAGCNMPTSRDEPVTEEPVVSDEMTLAEALAVPPEDRRGGVLEEMGAPDTFTIKFEELEGQVVRWEEWSYFDFNTRFDFVDGELIWTVELEPIPEDTIYAHFYDPHDFQPYMSEAEVRALLSEQELVELALEEAEIPGGLLLAGDQIMMGFEDDQLVYVETFALTFEEPGEGVAMLPTAESETETGGGVEMPTSAPTPLAPPTSIPSGPPTNTPAPGLPEPRATGELLLEDGFLTAGNAVPLFSSTTMTFEYVDGQGRLTGLTPGILPVMYPEPLLQNFILDVDITIQDMAPGSRAGVIFRSDDIENTLTYYYHLVLGPSDQVVALDRLKDGSYSLIKAQTVSSDLLPLSGTHRLRLEVEESTFRVFLNGTHVFDHTDTQIPGPGIVGLSIISAVPPEQVRFDNLKVYAMP